MAIEMIEEFSMGTQIKVIGVGGGGGNAVEHMIAQGVQGVQASGYITQDGSRAAELHLVDAPATLLTDEGLAALEHGVDIGIAALCAEGKSTINNVGQIERGYERIDERLLALGARIERVGERRA